MSNSVGQSLENASNTIVEALVKKMFEMNDRRIQRESELLSLHDSITKQLEENIIKQYENQKFKVPSEKGDFSIVALKEKNVVLNNGEKTVLIPLDKMESSLKPVGNEIENQVRSNEKYLSSKQIADSLNINDSTLRKYAQTLERNGHEFTKNNQNHRQFKESDLNIIEKTLSTSKEKGITLEKAAKEVVDSQKNNQLNTEKASQNMTEKVVYEGLNNHTKENKLDLNMKKEQNDFAAGLSNQELKNAKKLNHEVSENIERNIDKNFNDSGNKSIVPSQIRAQLEVVHQLKNLSEKEIIKSFKEASKQSKIENKPIPQLYKENIENIVNSKIKLSKDITLETAKQTQEKNQGLRNDLREIESKINANMGVLYQAKLEQKISLEEYNNLKENLSHQKNQIQERYDKLSVNENKINDQLKADLKLEFPNLKTDKLSLNESIQLASAAYTMTNEKTIENLRDFSLENDLKGVINVVDKATKEIEYEITEKTEITFSR